MKNFNVKQSGSEVILEEVNPYEQSITYQGKSFQNPEYHLFKPLPLTSIDPNIKVGDLIREDQLEPDKWQIQHTKGWTNLRPDEVELYKNSNAVVRQVAKLKQPVHETPKSGHINGTWTKKEESDHDLETNDMIEELKKQAKSVSLNSKEYWQLKAEYLQKYIDPTYSKQERRNCLMFWKILDRRIS